MRGKKQIGFLITSAAFLLVVSVTSLTGVAQSSRNRAYVKAGQSEPSRTANHIAREVRHELLMLPWYGVFDWIEGNVTPDGRVTLRGWVTRPTTKSSAVKSVKDIEGVTQVNDQIKVLPLSSNDDRLRIAVYRSLFNDNSPLFRYALGSNPSIHIIVENGRVTLKGVVSNEGDRNVANVKANGVSGVFEVNNQLVVEKGGE
ncbi:MAG TPA: BON domain-containing protein [Blastocatellia bacterium]|nr:BON domain-containing protein [Blastocatellia bacterium]